METGEWWWWCDWDQEWFKWQSSAAASKIKKIVMHKKSADESRENEYWDEWN